MIRHIGEADVLSAKVNPPHLAPFLKRLPHFGHVQGPFSRMPYPVASQQLPPVARAVKPRVPYLLAALDAASLNQRQINNEHDIKEST
jgi:hypothetical protein